MFFLKIFIIKFKINLKNIHGNYISILQNIEHFGQSFDAHVLRRKILQPSTCRLYKQIILAHRFLCTGQGAKKREAGKEDLPLGHTAIAPYTKLK